MMLLQGPFRTANIAVILSALLHIVAPVAGGFEASTFGMVPVGLFYLALAYGLSRGWRGLAYLTFLVMGCGMAAAMSAAVEKLGYVAVDRGQMQMHYMLARCCCEVR